MSDKRGLRRLIAASVLIVGISVVGVLALVLLQRRARAQDVGAREREEALGPRVRVAKVEASPSEREVTLPGDVRAIFQTTVYAKVSGYLKEIRVDKGQKVRKGQVLATIEAPEADQLLASAQADLALRQRDAERARTLAPPGVMSRQQLDTAEAQLRDARANVQRARAMTEYEVIRAPFAGTVTARYVDPGALLPAATGSTQSALPVVDMADTDRLRVSVYLGQSTAPFVHVGDAVEIWQQERADVRVQAAVTRIAEALDPRSRTMLCEADLDNRGLGILPGVFVQVKLKLKAPSMPVVPSEALFVRAGRNLVGVVEDGRVIFRQVEPGLFEARSVQLQAGVQPGELVALDLPSELSNGKRIRPMAMEQKQDQNPAK